MSKEQVPYLTESAIHLAHLCAVETWRGFNYTNGTQYSKALSLDISGSKSRLIKSVVMSDEYIMSRCTHQLFSVLKPKKYTVKDPINESFIDVFRDVAGIKQTERRGPKPNYITGLAYLKRKLPDEYKEYHKHHLDDKPTKILKAIENLSIAFTTQHDDSVQSEHVMLASRLLFFYFPDALVFNYSPNIATYLKLKGDAEKDINEYQSKLWEGYKENWNSLCKFEMPIAKDLDDTTYQIAKNSGWWQRRIYDLALKFIATKKDGVGISRKVKTSLMTHPKIIC